MRSHNSGIIHGENLHMLAVERKKLFLENFLSLYINFSLRIKKDQQ